MRGVAPGWLSHLDDTSVAVGKVGYAVEGIQKSLARISHGGGRLSSSDSVGIQIRGTKAQHSFRSPDSGGQEMAAEVREA